MQDEVSLKIFGDVQDILKGEVTSGLLRPVNQASFRFALGGGTFSDLNHIGETILIQGTPSITWMEHASIHTATKKEALAPFLMGIDQTQPIGDVCFFSPASSLPLEDFYQMLSKDYRLGFAIAGNFFMESLCGAYLKKAPISHENINEHVKEYWSETETIPDAKVFLFGVVVPVEGKQILNGAYLKKAFYQNPREQSDNSLLSHTHGAIVNDVVQESDTNTFLKEIEKLQVGGVRHILTQSIIKHGSYLCFPINNLLTV